jgi:Ca2+-transporting ATPase
VFNNIRKVIVYLLSDSFTAVILIAGALLLGLPLPLLPAQILWNNLVTDGLPNLALTVEPASKDVMKEKPRNAKEPLLNSKMRQLILTVGILTDIVLLFLFTFLIDRVDLATARTVMFAAFGFNSLVYAFSIKDLNAPIWKIPIFNNRWLLGAVGVGVALMMFALLHPSAQTLLDTVAIPAYLWWWIIGLSVIKLIAIEITKGFYRLKEGL